MQTRQEVEAIFMKARGNLLAIVVFSSINVILTALNINLNFLFSATIPTGIVYFGQGVSNGLGGSPVAVLIFAVIAMLFVGVFGLCYLLSKKMKGFMLVALILFILDTLWLAWLLSRAFDAEAFLNIAFHAWVLYYLVIGTKAWLDLKRLPPAEETPDAAEAAGTDTAVEAAGTDTAAEATSTDNNEIQ